MGKFNGHEKYQEGHLPPEQSPAPRTAVQSNHPVEKTTGSDNSNKSGFLHLAPPAQEDQETKSTHHVTSNTGDAKQLPLYGNGDRKVAAICPSDARRREEAREFAYQEKMRLAQAAHHGTQNHGDMAKHPSHGSVDVKVAAIHHSDALRREGYREFAHQEQMRLDPATHYDDGGGNTTKLSSQCSSDRKVAPRHGHDALRRQEAREFAYQEKMRLAQATQQGKSNVGSDTTKLPARQGDDMKVAAVHESDALRREEARDLVYQEKMKLAQAHPYRPAAQGSSRATGTTYPASGYHATDKKMEAFAHKDHSWLPPGPGVTLSLATQDDWSSSMDVHSKKANLKSDPDDDIYLAKRAFAENMKMQQQLPALATFEPVMPEHNQRTSRAFEGECLCLAPARAVSIENSMSSPDERPGASSDQNLLDEKRRMMEGSPGQRSEKQYLESMHLEKQAIGSGKRPSESYLPSTIQIGHRDNNRARATEDLTLAKNTLFIDPRAAPTELDAHAEELSVIDAIAASGMAQQLTASYTSTTSSSTGWVPPSNRMRTPAQGYTVHAGNKGPRENAVAPGAIAVAQRALGDRPASRSRADSNDSLEALDGMIHYSATAEGTEHSSSSGSHVNACATSGDQGLENAYSAWVASRDESFSNLPPAMRELARNQRAALFASRPSSSSVGAKIEEKRGMSIICIMFGMLVLVIALATGLGVGLGGGNDEPSSISIGATEAPTVGLNTSFFQSLVEDFYDDGGSIFNDTNSPQYQALLWVSSDPQSESLDVDRIRTLYALAVFYYSTNGEDFLANPTWNDEFGFLNSTTDDVCQWNNGDTTSDPKGLWCDPTKSKVERLYFSSNNLVGVIPQEIGMLKDLQYLLVADNRLDSTLPASLFELSDLRGLDLYGNLLSGTLPSTFVKATGLEILDFGSNQFHGPLPLEHLVDSSSCPLQMVVLAGNTFSGTFPLESLAANCTDITGININHCGLTVEGGIASFGLEELITLDLTRTELGGSIPDEISRLSSLQEFRAEHNALTGTIPASLGELIALTDLTLSNNNLSGSLPPELGQLEQLKSLVLSSNILSGTMPSELALCTNLVEVKLEMNMLTGDFDVICSLSFEELTSDCKTWDIVCSCCTECH